MQHYLFRAFATNKVDFIVDNFHIITIYFRANMDRSFFTHDCDCHRACFPIKRVVQNTDALRFNSFWSFVSYLILISFYSGYGMLLFGWTDSAGRKTYFNTQPCQTAVSWQRSSLSTRMSRARTQKRLRLVQEYWSQNSKYSKWKSIEPVHWPTPRAVLVISLINY